MQIGKSLVLLLLLAGAAACSTGRAQAIEDKPTLVVPPVPPRSINPAPVIEPPPVAPEPAPMLPPPPAPAKSRPAARNETKPEPKPEAPPEAGNSTLLPNPPPPVAPLRTATTPTGPEAAKQVREILGRAENVLSRVDYQKLTADRRATYDSAKSFIEQAEAALKKEDLTLARSFADRAQNIAKQLEAR